MSIWQQCLEQLESQLNAQQFNTWIRPLQAVEEENALRLFAPNRFVLDWVNEKFFDNIQQIATELDSANVQKVVLEIGSRPAAAQKPVAASSGSTNKNPEKSEGDKTAPVFRRRDDSKAVNHTSNLRSEFTFSSFVEGKSNQIAKAAAVQIGENPGVAYNPLFVYGGVGLGKTHLMHAVGNLMLQKKSESRIVYVHSERFVGDMVKALQHNSMNDFKRYYRSVDALLIDDIQFFAGKERSQEELFHTFNSLIEGHQQIIISCDRYPKEIDGLEERLKSRFGWGLTVAVEPPELETRVAILMSKAQQMQIDLPHEVAFFMAKRVRSNVRELEGALRRVIANSRFMARAITLDFAKDALRDLLAAQDKLVTIENIQKTTAEYYKIRVADLLSKKRSRSIARPRQLAMALAKELTNHSLPEIGDAFGGRDHTTVMHAVKKINELKDSDVRVNEDHQNLLRILST